MTSDFKALLPKKLEFPCYILTTVNALDIERFLRSLPLFFYLQPVEWEDLRYSERSNGKSEIVEHNQYSGSKANSPKKLDKRQETVLKDLKSYLLTEYANEEEQRQKLRELGVSLVGSFCVNN